MNHDDIIKNAAIAIGLGHETVDRLLFTYRNLIAAGYGLPVQSRETQRLVDLLRQTYDFTSPPLGRATAGDACRAVGIESPSRSQCLAMGVALRIATQRKPYKSNGRLIHVVPQKKCDLPIRTEDVTR